MTKRLNENNANDFEEEKKARRAGKGVFLSVAFLFLVIICITEAVSMHYGKITGTIVLVIIGIVLAAYLYKDEIIDFFKRK